MAIDEDRQNADQNEPHHGPAAAPPSDDVGVADDTDRQADRDELGHSANNPHTPRRTVTGGDNQERRGGGCDERHDEQAGEDVSGHCSPSKKCAFAHNRVQKLY